VDHQATHRVTHRHGIGTTCGPFVVAGSAVCRGTRQRIHIGDNAGVVSQQVVTTCGTHALA